MRLADVAKGFEEDADTIRNSSEHLDKLLILVRGLRNVDKTEAYATMRLVKDDFAPNHSKTGDNKELFEYLIKKCRQAPWAIPVLLGWLAFYHPARAQKYYAECEIPFRSYPKKPGDWSREAAKGPRALIPQPTATTGAKKKARHGELFASAPIRLPHNSGVLCSRFSRQGDRIVSGTAEGDVAVWVVSNLRNASPRLNVKSFPGQAAHASFSPDGERLAALAWDGSGGLCYSSIAEAPLYPKFSHGCRTSTVAFSPDGTRFVTAAWDGHIRVWDAKDGNLLLKFPLPALEVDELDEDDPEDDRAINSAYYSPCGKFIISSCTECSAAEAYNTGFVHIFDALTGNYINRLVAHRSGGCSASFSPSGKMIVTSGCDCSARVWEAGSLNPLGIFKGKSDLRHKDYVWDADFSPDETMIVTASADGFVNLWDIETKAILARLPHGGPVNMAKFSPCGKKILTACDDHYAYLWTIRP